MHLHHILREPSHALAKLTAYLTVHNTLSSWYGTEGMAQKPRRNRHFLRSQVGGNGFRGRVSQVRILPGPLYFLSLLALTRPDSFQAPSEA
jgi:hypothetical protein